MLLRSFPITFLFCKAPSYGIVPTPAKVSKTVICSSVNMEIRKWAIEGFNFPWYEHNEWREFPQFRFEYGSTLYGWLFLNACQFFFAKFPAFEKCLFKSFFFTLLFGFLKCNKYCFKGVPSFENLLRKTILSTNLNPMSWAIFSNISSAGICVFLNFESPMSIKHSPPLAKTS